MPVSQPPTPIGARHRLYGTRHRSVATFALDFRDFTAIRFGARHLLGMVPGTLLGGVGGLGEGLPKRRGVVRPLAVR